MSFKVYTSRKQGFRARDDEHISIGKSRIGLGKVKLPWDWIIISYDIDAKAIKFTEGAYGDGFKVSTDAGKTTYLAAKSFTGLHLLPYGLYKRKKGTHEQIFILREEYLSEQL